MSGDIKLEIGADDAKILASAKRQQKEFRKVTKEVADSGKNMKKMETQVSRGAMSTAAMAASFTAVSAAITTAIALAKQLTAEQEKAATSRLSEEQTTSTLLSLANRSRPAEVLLAEKANLQRTMGLTGNEAASFAHARISAGISEADSLRMLRMNMGPGETLNLAQSSASIKAASGSNVPLIDIAGKLQLGGNMSQKKASEISTGILTLTGTDLIGTSPSEAIGLIAGLESSMGGPEKAGTAFSALSLFMKSKGINEGGIMGNIDKVSESELLKQKKALAAFSALQRNRGVAEETIAAISGAGAEVLDYTASEIQRELAPEITTRRALMSTAEAQDRVQGRIGLAKMKFGARFDEQSLKNVEEGTMTPAMALIMRSVNQMAMSMGMIDTEAMDLGPALSRSIESKLSSIDRKTAPPSLNVSGQGE